MPSERHGLVGCTSTRTTLLWDSSSRSPGVPSLLQGRPCRPRSCLLGPSPAQARGRQGAAGTARFAGGPSLSACRVPGAVGALSRHKRGRPHGVHLPPGAVPARVLSYRGGKAESSSCISQTDSCESGGACRDPGLVHLEGGGSPRPASRCRRGQAAARLLQQRPACVPRPGRSSGGPAVPGSQPCRRVQCQECQ